MSAIVRESKLRDLYGIGFEQKRMFKYNQELSSKIKQPTILEIGYLIYFVLIRYRRIILEQE